MSAELETAEYLQALTIKLIVLNNSTSIPIHKILEDHYRPNLHAQLHNLQDRLEPLIMFRVTLDGVKFLAFVSI